MQNFYGSNHSYGFINALKQNLNQLSKTAKFKGLKFDEQLVKHLIQGDNLQLIEEYTLKLKEELYRPKFPVYAITIGFFSVCSLGSLFYLTFRINSSYNFLCTLMILCPLALMFGFVWWKFRDYFESGYMFGLWSILFGLMDIVLSPGTWYLIVLNSLISIGAKLIHLFISSHEFMDFFGFKILTTILFLRVGSAVYKTKLGLYINSLLSSLLIIFFLTQHIEYFVYGFHPVGFLLYSSIFISLLVGIFGRALETIPIPLTILLLTLHEGELSLLFLSFQYNYIFPQLLQVENSRWIHLSHQASMTYILHHVFFFFTFNQLSVLDWQVDPLRGTVGIQNWNTYPRLSGFFMVYSKFGVFLLSTTHSLILSKKVEGLVKFAVMLSLFEVFFTSLLCHWIIAVYTVNHLLDSCLTLLIIFSTNCLFLSLLYFFGPHPTGKQPLSTVPLSVKIT